jgi:hypothetical protein
LEFLLDRQIIFFLPLSHMGFTPLLYWDMAFGRYTTTSEDCGKESKNSNQKKIIRLDFEI